MLCKVVHISRQTVPADDAEPLCGAALPSRDGAAPRLPLSAPLVHGSAFRKTPRRGVSTPGSAIAGNSLTSVGPTEIEIRTPWVLCRYNQHTHGIIDSRAYARLFLTAFAEVKRYV